MILWLFNWFAARMRARGRTFMIPAPDGSDYLERIAISGDLPRRKVSRKLNIFLHRILQADGDRDPHNHPFTWCFTIVLWGGYTEERIVGPFLWGKARRRRRLYPFWLNPFRCINILGSVTRSPGAGQTRTGQEIQSRDRMRAKDFHRITQLHGRQTWTLVIAGGKLLEWGFAVPFRGYVPEQHYQARNEPARVYAGATV